MLNSFQAEVYRKAIFEQLNVIGVLLDKGCIDKIKTCIDTDILIEVEKIIIGDTVSKTSHIETKKKIEDFLG